MVIVAHAVLAAPVWAQDKVAAQLWWPQFRGPDGLGVAAQGMGLPAQLSPDKNLAWKVPVVRGHSSPCISGERIFLTSHDKDKKQLTTLCLDRKTGQTVWTRPLNVPKIEPTHQISSAATPTPATDGERVYVYFGSYGLVCYDFNGKQLWEHPLPMPQTRFGTGQSPVVAGDLVILSCDYLPKSYVLAVNRVSGQTVWKQEFIPGPMEGYATPLIWKHEGAAEIVLHMSNRVLALDLKDGEQRWWIAVKSTAGSTPVLGDGKVFVSTWIHGGEAENLVPIPPFDKFVADHDKDKDGKISKAEFPDNMLLVKRKEVTNVGGAEVKMIWYFGQIDKNKDGKIEAGEWGNVQNLGYSPTEHGLLAIKPGGQGDAAKSHIAWTQTKSIPEIASPLYYQGLVYLVREGGIVTCLDAKNGQQYYKERLGADGAYFSSPVAGDGKVYAGSYAGGVSVFAAGKKFQLLSKIDLGEHIMATPALVDGHVYIRTEKHLYAFGK